MFSWVADHINELFYGAFIGFGVFSALKFQVIYKYRGELKDAAARLKNYTINDFPDAFETFSAEIQDSVLGVQWVRYERTFARVSSENGDVVYMTQFPEDYFSIAALLDSSKVNFLIFKSMPGIFTGLGILGTFAGLSVGLQSVHTESAQVLQQGIVGLLGGTTTAFLTSVIGLILAILFNLAYGNLVRSINHLVDDIQNSFYQLFPQKNQEEYFAEIASLSQQQTNEMRQLNTDMVTQLGEMFEKLGSAIDVSLEKNLLNSFSQTITPSLDNLNQSIEKLNSSAGDSLSKSIQEGAGTQIQGLASSLTDLQARISSSIAESERVNQENNMRVQESLETLIGKLNQAMDDSIQKQAANMDNTNETMRALLSEMNDNMKNAVDQMVQAGSTANQALLQTSEATKGTIQDITQMMTSSSQQQKADMVAATASMKESLSEVLEKLHEDMNNRDKLFKQQINELQRIISSNNQMMTSAGSTADKFARASTPIKQAADAMSGQLTLVMNAYNKFNANVSDHVRLLAESAQNNQKDRQQLLASLQETRQAWTSYESHFKGISGELQTTFGVIERAIQQYNTETNNLLTKALADFDKSINTALNQMSAVNENLSDSLSDFTDTVNKQRR